MKNGSGKTRELVSSPLADAAAALEQELRRFEELAAAVQRAPLTSQKTIERAAHTVGDAAESQKRLGERLGELIQAINVARERQQAGAEAINTRAEDIKSRGQRLGELLQAYSELGEEAKGINTSVQQIAAEQRGEDQAAVNFVHARLAEVDERMGRVVERAEAIAKSASAEDFPELERQADSLRQQMLSTRNRLKLLRDKLPPPQIA